MIQNDSRLALKDFMTDKWILVAFFLVGMSIRFKDDIVYQLFDALVIEEAPHRFRRVDKSCFNIFFIENIL